LAVCLSFLVGFLLGGWAQCSTSLYLVTKELEPALSPRFVGLANLFSLLEDDLLGKSLTVTAYYTFVGGAAAAGSRRV
jgi:ABC-type sugar transport system permease subunit